MSGSAASGTAARRRSSATASSTATDATTDIYPHLVTEAAISALTTTVHFAPTATPAQRERLLHRSFALLRAGLQHHEER